MRLLNSVTLVCTFNGYFIQQRQTGKCEEKVFVPVRGLVRARVPRVAVIFFHYSLIWQQVHHSQLEEHYKVVE